MKRNIHEKETDEEMDNTDKVIQKKKGKKGKEEEEINERIENELNYNDTLWSKNIRENRDQTNYTWQMITMYFSSMKFFDNLALGSVEPTKLNEQRNKWFICICVKSSDALKTSDETKEYI